MNIYVGNLYWQASEPELKELFEAYGQVSSVKIIKDRYTDEPRGFGFVEMPNDGEGHAAIQALNGKELGERALRVSVARPREDRGGGRRSGRRNRNW